MDVEQKFADKVIIVTGGTSGIGRELVRQLSTLGARLYICGRNPKPGEDLVRELAAHPGRVRFYPVDVSNSAGVETFVSQVLQDGGHIDYLFHCAGIILGGEFRDHQLQDIEKVIQTNVFGTAYMSFYTYRIMAKQGFGHIVNVGSAAGLFPVPLMGLYSATKFFVFGLSEILHLEGKGIGVRVSTVAPGIVDTPIYETGSYSNTDKGFAKTLLKKRLYTIQPDQAARIILKGVVRNRTVIHTQPYVRCVWLSYRYLPYVFRWVMARGMRPYRTRLRKP